MVDQAYSERTIDILNSANHHGFALTKSTLARWHRCELVPRPKIERLGKGHGTRSLYPHGTTQQVLTLLKFHKRFSGLEDVGFCLWLAGYPVGERFSVEYLKRTGEKLDKIIGRLRDARARLDSDDDNISEPMWEELSKISNARTPIKFARMLRKRVGAKNFDAAALLVVDIATGQFHRFSTEDHNRYFRSMMGIKNIGPNILAGRLNWLKASIEAPLRNLSVIFLEMPFADQVSLETKNSLYDARSEFYQLFFGLSSFVGGIFKVSGLKLPAFYQLHEVIHNSKSEDLAWMLLVWYRMRKTSWASGYHDVISALRLAGIHGETWEINHG